MNTTHFSGPCSAWRTQAPLPPYRTFRWALAKSFHRFLREQWPERKRQSCIVVQKMMLGGTRRGSPGKVLTRNYTCLRLVMTGLSQSLLLLLLLLLTLWLGWLSRFLLRQAWFQSGNGCPWRHLVLSFQLHDADGAEGRQMEEWIAFGPVGATCIHNAPTWSKTSSFLNRTVAWTQRPLQGTKRAVERCIYWAIISAVQSAPSKDLPISPIRGPYPGPRRSRTKP